MTKANKIKVIRRWMKYVNITLSDMDINDPLEQLEDCDINEILEIASEDRSRLIQDGYIISEDWITTT